MLFIILVESVIKHCFNISNFFLDKLLFLKSFGNFEFSAFNKEHEWSLLSLSIYHLVPLILLLLKVILKFTKWGACPYFKEGQLMQKINCFVEYLLFYLLKYFLVIRLLHDSEMTILNASNGGCSRSIIDQSKFTKWFARLQHNSLYE